MLSFLPIVLCIQFMAISLETQPFVMCHVKFAAICQFCTIDIILYTCADNLTVIYACLLVIHSLRYNLDIC